MGTSITRRSRRRPCAWRAAQSRSSAEIAITPAMPSTGDQSRARAGSVASVGPGVSSISRTTGTPRRRSRARKKARRTAGRGVQSHRQTASRRPSRRRRTRRAAPCSQPHVAIRRRARNESCRTVVPQVYSKGCPGSRRAPPCSRPAWDGRRPAWSRRDVDAGRPAPGRPDARGSSRPCRAERAASRRGRRPPGGWRRPARARRAPPRRGRTRRGAPSLRPARLRCRSDPCAPLATGARSLVVVLPSAIGRPKLTSLRRGAPAPHRVGRTRP